MRSVPIKTVDQTGHLTVHLACQGFVEQRASAPTQMVHPFGAILWGLGVWSGLALAIWRPV